MHSKLSRLKCRAPEGGEEEMLNQMKNMFAKLESHPQME
jgi:hypothetical protein